MDAWLGIYIYVSTADTQQRHQLSTPTPPFFVVVLGVLWVLLKDGGTFKSTAVLALRAAGLGRGGVQ